MQVNTIAFSGGIDLDKLSENQKMEQKIEITIDDRDYLIARLCGAKPFWGKPSEENDFDKPWAKPDNDIVGKIITVKNEPIKFGDIDIRKGMWCNPNDLKALMYD